ncbi:biotin transporter BioY [Alicyclobacillaceae bacterium I2511]|nr:biotin transporter BioY [Alicyclobacillaceae bacterium I2511]
MVNNPSGGCLVTVKGIVFSALFAALMVVLGYFQISLPFTPVPIILGNLAVMLAGALLGPVYGFFSVALVVLLSVLGLPLIQGHSGLGLLLGASGGFVWGWPIAALLTGWAVSRVKGYSLLSWLAIFVSIEVFGALFDYLPAIPQLMAVAHLSFAKAMVEGCYPFLLGDTLKALVASLVVWPVRRVFPPARLTGRQGPPVVHLDA